MYTEQSKSQNMTCMYRMSTTETKIENDIKNDIKKDTTGISVLIIISILYSIPLALWYSVVYAHGGGFLNSLLLFGGIYGLGLLAIMLYYRMNLASTSEKMPSSQIKSIMMTTFISFMVVLITMLILGVNSDLLSIFENTIGIWFIGLMGNSSFISEIFPSSVFSKLEEETDTNIFNKNFLMTRFNLENIDHFIKFFEKSCDGQTHDSTNIELPFDFKPVFENVGQLSKLRDLVSLKRTVGHFSWIYLTSIVSLTMGLIAVTMK